MKVKAYAKINLGLKILNKRKDGFHNIETVFHKIDLFDEIIFSKHKSEIIIETKNIKSIDNKLNLCYKAAKLLKDFCNIKSGIKISIKKNIPIGAGLGGGSSDAANTLLALKKIWHCKISDKDLNKIALKLGSDVPFFLNRGSAIAKGRGEKLKYFNLKLPYWILVVNPGVHISTAWAYNEISKLKNRKISHLKNLDLKSLKLENDFEQIVFKKFKKINLLKNKLLNSGAKYVLLSGSGSSLFGLFENEIIAKKTKNKIKYFTNLTSPDF